MYIVYYLFRDLEINSTKKICLLRQEMNTIILTKILGSI